MHLSSGHWYAVASSRELRRRPVAKVRFGQRLVFWRGAAGTPVCMQDQCAHRGAALSLGRLRDGCIECPFHGFRYNADGQCTRVPAEGDRPIPGQLRVGTLPVREDAGFIWLWRGPTVAAEALPPVPSQPLVAGLAWGETSYVWNAHYTRCVESVIDFSHLPFVHRTSLGLFIRNPMTRVVVKSRPDGFRASQIADDFKEHFVDFTYPNFWVNQLSRRYFVAAAFAPMDDNHTEAYIRWYDAVHVAALRPLVDLVGRGMQRLVFHADLPIIATQRPSNVDDADGERLVPSDAAHVAYRRLRRLHQDELRRHADNALPPGTLIGSDPIIL